MAQEFPEAFWRSWPAGISRNLRTSNHDHTAHHSDDSADQCVILIVIDRKKSDCLKNCSLLTVWNQHSHTELIHFQPDR